MAPNKSLDVSKIIAATLFDVSLTHGVVFNYTSYRNTMKIVNRRLASEGISFLTKTLPRLGKAFDKALAGDTPLNCTDCRFSAINGTRLPRFLGELFKEVLCPNGTVLQRPCAKSVRTIREVLYLFYKYELPYTAEQEQQVISKFERTEDDLLDVTRCLDELATRVNNIHPYSRSTNTSQDDVVREVRRLLSNLFAFFDPKDIYPRHGPGVVATKQRLWDKYLWTNVSARITDKYPFDAYFCASLGHVCDSYRGYKAITEEDLPAKVILVPKDSRGPRLISCEPVDFQWVQQGLGRAIVQLVESTELTKFNVFFTNQQPNQFGALLGSLNGRYATLDLNEASDRVSTALVRLLFPPHIYEYLEACRSLSTVLPNGKEIKLRKFAPMGSSLCFPILALTTWAILTAAAPDQDTRDGILVYGDDVIVPTGYSRDAIEQLESFGLKVNRDKSCTKGSFRESCGVDAFTGINVTPLRIRTVWSSTPTPESYTSWIAYANSFYDRRYFTTYEYIVGELVRLYGPIPDNGMSLTCPSLRELPLEQRSIRSRYNKSLQKKEFKVLDLKTPVVTHVSDGWSMLLRFFAERGVGRPTKPTVRRQSDAFASELPFSVSSYTQRRTSMLVRQWR